MCFVLVAFTLCPQTHVQIAAVVMVYVPLLKTCPACWVQITTPPKIMLGMVLVSIIRTGTQSPLCFATVTMGTSVPIALSVRLNTIPVSFTHALLVEMCPKGDDPLTTSQNNRQIAIVVNNTDNVALSGTLGIEFMGTKAYLSLDNPTNSTCKAALEASAQIGAVECGYTVVTSQRQRMHVTFLDWPAVSSDNNLFANNGNPSVSDFYCDVSQASEGVECFFIDLVNSNIKGKLASVFCWIEI